MTQCDRSNCKKDILRRTEAGNAGLCEYHYQRFKSNQQNKERRLLSTCQYCGQSLAETKNKQYCCAACRQKDSRKVSSDNTVSILDSSYWRHIEKTMKRNPHLLDSITGLEDVLDYHHLYIIKSRHQRSYAITSDEGDKGILKPTPLLQLAICHQYPNSKGGANTSNNLMIAPELINHRLNDTIPHQHHGFPGIKSTGECIPFNGSLYDGLVEQYGVLTVNEELSRITPVRRFHGNAPKEIEFGGIEQQLPLFTLLYEELWRLGHHKVSECLMEIKQLFHCYPLYLELLAIVGFYAVLSGDPDRIMALLCRVFNKCFNSASLMNEPHKKYLSLMYCFLRKYLHRYFSVAIDNRESVVTFYNGFYSQEIIAPGDAEDEVLCYRYFTGIKRSAAAFFYVPPWKKTPADLWLLMGDDLTFE